MPSTEIASNINKKSSAISQVSFSESDNQVILTFTSNPDKQYPYTVAEGRFHYVVEAFSLTESVGAIYHELVNNSIIFPLK
jgi:hypothetical protein